MLRAHLEAVEGHLLAISQIPANTGHSLHKGTPREAFIREFLENHLSEKVAIGTGEIIDCNSQPNPPSSQQRHQYDIIIYKRDYPRLSIGGGVAAFLAESVVATIEVKSTLVKDEFQGVIRAAHASKQLQRNIISSFHTGYQPPGVLNYVVAYAGPASMSTVHGWIRPIHDALGIATPTLPVTGDERAKQQSPSLDGVFVLGQGSLLYDSAPIGFSNDEYRQRMPNASWQAIDMPNGNLALLFLLLTVSVSGVSASWLNPAPYLARSSVQPIKLLP